MDGFLWVSIWGIWGFLLGYCVGVGWRFMFDVLVIGGEGGR